MTTKETNDLMSLIADTAFRIGAGIIIDKAYIEYHLDQVEDKDIREAQESLVYCKIPNIFMENIISRYPVMAS